MGFRHLHARLYLSPHNRLEFPLLTLLLPTLLQLLHMRIMIRHVLLIRRNIALAMTRQVLTPSALALLLLPELVLLGGFDLFGRAVGVFLDEEAGCGSEGSRCEGCADDGAREGTHSSGVNAERHYEGWRCRSVWDMG